MATEPLRLCVNCKHHEALSKHTTQWCTKDVTVTRTQSNVDGAWSEDTYGLRYCDTERQYRGLSCGPAAQHYVEKRRTKRLIAWFKA